MDGRIAWQTDLGLHVIGSLIAELHFVGIIGSDSPPLASQQGVDPE
jgi:hypothetical protein